MRSASHGPGVEQVAGLVEQGEVDRDHPVAAVSRSAAALGPRRVGSATVNGPVASGHGPAPATASTASPSPTEVAKLDTQSMLGLAGTTPSSGRAPGAAFSPTTPHRAAGTRPEPAVSVPRAKATWRRATATAEPDDDPPGTSRSSSGLRGVP